MQNAISAATCKAPDMQLVWCQIFTSSTEIYTYTNSGNSVISVSGISSEYGCKIISSHNYNDLNVIQQIYNMNETAFLSTSCM
jgi:hypothetical protein